MQLGQGYSALFAQSPLNADRCRAPYMPGPVCTLLYAARCAVRYPHIAASSVQTAEHHTHISRSWDASLAAVRRSLVAAPPCSALFCAAPLCIERCCEPRTIAHNLLDACQNKQKCADRQWSLSIDHWDLRWRSFLIKCGIVNLILRQNRQASWPFA